MAVPDTNTFSLQDVVNEVNPTTDDLVDSFADADAAEFDPAYEGSKNSLLNFRNYGASDPLAVSPRPINIGISNSSQIVNVTTDTGWTALITSGSSWFNISGGSGFGNGSFTVNYTAFLNESRTGGIRVETSGGTIIDIVVNEIA